MIDNAGGGVAPGQDVEADALLGQVEGARPMAVSYTHLRAQETVLDIVCRLLLEKKNIAPNVTAKPTTKP